MKRCFTLFLSCLVIIGLNAQTNPVPQQVPFAFNTLSGSVLPAGIAVHRFGTTAADIPLTRTVNPGNADLPNNSGGTTGGWRSEGDNGIGILASGSNAAGALIVSINTTGKSNIQIDWIVRTILQQASRDNSIAMQYRLGSTGNFTDIGSSVYNSAGTDAGDFNGYREFLPAAAENQSEVQLRWVYWESASTSGSRDRLAIDDIRIETGCTPPSNQPSSLSLAPSLTSISGTFNAATPGSIAAGGYLVLMSNSPALTALPSSGTVYAVDDVIGNAVVLSNNANTTFAANQLTPSTNYYFYLFSFTAADICYKLPNPLTGNVTTNSPAPCNAPATQVSNVGANGITGTSIPLNYTRGNGDNILIVARLGNAVNDNPINGVNYAAGSKIGTDNTVIYNGPASSYNYAGLQPNSTWHFALYEYNNSSLCYLIPPAAANFTTLCTTPVEVNALNGTGANGSVSLSWTNPVASCFSEVLVVASNISNPSSSSGNMAPANTSYSGSNQVVYRGTGTGVTVSGLTNGTVYYFKVFTRNGADYTKGVEISVAPRDPASGFLYLYGNLHAHSAYSDGNKDSPSKTPKEDFEYARDANCMDFLGISEHNHAGAGMSLADYPKGYQQANLLNNVTSAKGNNIVTLWGMEWGVISGGGHVLVYGFDDQLIGWEANNYNIFCAKNDYTSLFNLVNERPNTFATLAHPSTTDFGNISATYNASADNAIFSSAVESGPAFSTDTAYKDFPSSLSFLGYYKRMLAKGYHLGAQMDHDNHNFTFGRSSTNRMVVLAATKSRADIVSGIKSMRFYASQDCNVRVDYKCNGAVMGSSLSGSGVPTLNVSLSDPDGETSNNIEIWGGLVGGATPTATLKSFPATSLANFSISDVANTQPDNTTWYYFAIITQADGNKVVTSPIWYTRNDGVLPVQLVDFSAAYESSSKVTRLVWTTASELNSKSFVIERSIPNKNIFSPIGTVDAEGSANTTHFYNFTDLAPVDGTSLYRLKMIDRDGVFSYSKVSAVSVNNSLITKYSMYPNPATAFTYINTTSATVKKVLIEVLDASGRSLKNQTAQLSASSPVRLNIQGLQPGVYLIKITGEGMSGIEKLLVK